MAQILRDPTALRQLADDEVRAESYEAYSQATPFERGVGILADALEHWGANDDGQYLRRSSAARRTTRDLEGRSYDIALHSDGRAPAWPPGHVLGVGRPVLSECRTGNGARSGAVDAPCVFLNSSLNPG